MSQLAVAIAGAGIGAFTGNPVAGFAIGSAIGGALFPGKLDDLEGPRLGDLKIQSGSYGTMIPIVYGAVRIAGNMIWTTSIKESKSTTSSGGKGGGAEQTTTSFSYTASFAVGLCVGPISAIRKIWADGVLVYDLSDTADLATIASSRILAANMIIYTGTETQLPDPRMESDKGVGNVPSYAGLAYVVFDALPLGQFGNRIPNFTFEALGNSGLGFPEGTITEYILDPITGPDGESEYPTACTYDPITRSIWTVSNGDLIFKTNVYTGKTEYFPASPAFDVIFDKNANQIWSCYYNSLYRFDIYTGARTIYSTPGSGLWLAHNPIDNSIWIANDGGYNPGFRVNHSSGDTTEINMGGYNRSIVFDSATNSMWVASDTNSTIRKISTANYTGVDYSTGGLFASEIVFDNITNSIWLVSDVTNQVRKIDVFTGTGTTYAAPVGCVYITFDPKTKSIWIPGTTVMRKIDIYTGVGVDYPKAGSVSTNIAFDEVTRSIWWGHANLPAAGTQKISRMDTAPYGITAAGVPLADVLSDLCLRSGLSSSDINVTGITDIVDGYAIANQMSARNAIEPLRLAYYVDAVESQNTVKFVKRGTSSVATIDAENLGAHMVGESIPDNLPIWRQQEIELPAVLNVVYASKDMHHQQSTQQSKRIATRSKQAASVEIAVSMSDEKAKEIAEVLLYDAWIGRITYSPSVTREFALIEPTDVVTIVKDGTSHAMRITSKKESRNGIIKWEAVAVQSSVYTQAAAAGKASTQQGSIGPTSPTKMLLLDIPLLREEDDNSGFYGAARGSEPWPGAVVYKSIDGGASYNASVSFIGASTIGATNGALGNFLGGNTFDEANFIDVVLDGGSLSSTTEIAILNGANAALIGSEIIQYKNAVLTGALTYRLSGLLRGRKGTEWAMSSHVDGERFVWLDSTTLRRFTAVSELNLARRYKAVTIGDTIQSAGEQTFTYTGVNLECLAPVHLGGGRADNGDLTIKWVRRTRIGGSWNSFVDASLGELVESYETEIWNSAFTVLYRTLSSAVQTTTYTSAQQVIDSGGNQAAVSVRVYQLSSAVGRGYVLQGQV